MKKLMRAFFAFCFVTASQLSHAGIPVFDGAAIVQAIQQVAAWQQQYEQMVNQINQLTQQVNAITGGRGMGSILNSSQTNGLLPDEVQNLQASINAMVSGTPLTASRKSASQGILSSYGVDTTSPTYESLGNGATVSKGQEFAKSKDAEKGDISKLKDTINTTADLKASLDLNSAILVKLLETQQNNQRQAVQEKAEAAAIALKDLAADQQALKAKVTAFVQAAPQF